ncbi:MAG: AmmeMemoRadiSam system protein B [Deltaproteobacteria bacterium RIFCSPLOWO2_02_FULL_53_8]|nr:MAG: AmmeMemoRadiSam system protein B [Deltaproteobacteria bacterium RIFCSPLOWO2_02_FULL_53_8]
MVRRPCVAGRFYPQESETLRGEVSAFLDTGAQAQAATAIMSPHAGYVYSGGVAGAVFSSVVIPDTVVLIGPNHTGLGENAAVMPKGSWQMPFGSMRVNEELAGALVDSSALFAADNAAHLMEHSLEVQLPFLYQLNSSVSIVPVTVMRADIAECEEMGMALAKAVAGCGRDVLIVISSDMTHYESERSAKAKDKLAIARICALDGQGLLDVAEKKDITMCGVIPAVIAIFAAKKLGAKHGRLVRYATSGEVSGDFTQVVGYAGIVIS